MPDPTDDRLLDVLLDSRDRNDAILRNLLRVLPDGGLAARVRDVWMRRCRSDGAAEAGRGQSWLRAAAGRGSAVGGTMPFSRM
jgi:hypothetical protein